MPSRSLPHHDAPLPRLKTVAPGALIGAAVGAALGLLLDGVLATALLALAGALLVTALIAAMPDRPASERRERPPPDRPHPHPPPPPTSPTTTLAVPPLGPDAPPGWYPDPDPESASPGVRRLWDGERWTEHRWSPRE